MQQKSSSGSTLPSPVDAAAAASTSAPIKSKSSDQARLQFRFTDGRPPIVHTFNSSTSLSDCMPVLASAAIPVTRTSQFQLMMPRRVFTLETDGNVSLLDLGLSPSASLLVTL